MSEFSHRILAGRIGERETPLRLDAGPTARAALAARFGLLDLSRLEADLTLVRDGTAIHVNGRLLADVVQQCVVSAEPVAARVDVPVTLIFEQDPTRVPDDEEEVTAETADILPIEDGGFDIGEAVAQSMFLALDPYPRANAATLAAARRHLLTEAEAEEADAAARAAGKAAGNPFSVLRGGEQD